MQRTLSTAIKTELVTHILLPDGWHKVGPFLPNEPESSLSFDLVPFSLDNGDDQASVPVPGFSFCEAGTGFDIHGPLSSIRGIKKEALDAPQSHPARLWRAFSARLRRLVTQPAAS